METKISSKSELNSLASKLVSYSTELKSFVDELKTILTGIPNYEDINVSGVGSILASNMTNISSDMELIASAIQNYIIDIEEFDVYDFDLDAELNKSASDSKGGSFVSSGISSSVTSGQSSTSSFSS